MNGQPDEFCLVDTLPPISTPEGSGFSRDHDRLALGANAPDTPAPPPVVVESQSIDGWGPPVATPPPRVQGHVAAPHAATPHRVTAAPWSDDVDRQSSPMISVAEDEIESIPSGCGEGKRPFSKTPRRKRSTSGINRERQHSGGGKSPGRRREGLKNGKGGLSKKTLNIVTNLESHTAPVRSRQEMEEVEEEKRLAEEEKRFKENLRQKGDDFDYTIRILLLGDSGVGKTSLMLRFSDDNFAPSLISTAGVDYKVQTLDIRGKRVRCQIWDTAGQEKFHVITRAYYRGAHGIALAYDVTDGDSFKNVNYWMANIQTHLDPGQRVQKMILGNKIDIQEREISSKAGQDVAKEFGVRFFEVSAKNGYGVTDAFSALAVDILQVIEAAHKREDDERRGSRGLARGRLRSLTSRKTTFSLGRKFGSFGKGHGKGGSEHAAGSSNGEGGLSKHTPERCKVS